MDMKKILQAVDAGSAKSTQPADDEMKRIVSIISEGRRSLNRLTQAESTVVNHYTKKENTVLEQQPRLSSIDKYFKAVEQEKIELSEHVNLQKKEKAQQLAERAIAEVGGHHGHFSKLDKYVSRSKKMSARLKSTAKDGARLDTRMRKRIQRETDEVDTVTLDIPLFIRLLEYAKEDAKTDMDLHNVAEKAIKLSKDGALGMDNYDAIVGDQKSLPAPDTTTENKDPCWKDYKSVGTKKKNGKTVPNCVPKK